MPSPRAVLIWAALAAAVAAPLAVAAASPLHAWRDPVYIAAGFAGIVALALLLLQPLLAGGLLPGLEGRRGRRLHAWVGGGLAAAVLVHVVGLWITSPPDVIDALLFRSPTPFSAWGVVAMWTALAAALFAALRRLLRLAPPVWRAWHLAFAGATALGAALHALLVEGAMGTATKAALCALAVAAVAKVTIDRRPWAALARPKR